MFFIHLKYLLLRKKIGDFYLHDSQRNATFAPLMQILTN